MLVDKALCNSKSLYLSSLVLKSLATQFILTVLFLGVVVRLLFCIISNRVVTAVYTWRKWDSNHLPRATPQKIGIISSYLIILCLVSKAPDLCERIARLDILFIDFLITQCDASYKQ